jgi:hypothetical protein
MPANSFILGDERGIVSTGICNDESVKRIARPGLIQSVFDHRCEREPEAGGLAQPAGLPSQRAKRQRAASQ